MNIGNLVKYKVLPNLDLTSGLFCSYALLLSTGPTCLHTKTSFVTRYQFHAHFNLRLYKNKLLHFINTDCIRAAMALSREY